MRGQGVQNGVIIPGRGEKGLRLGLRSGRLRYESQEFGYFQNPNAFELNKIQQVFVATDDELGAGCHCAFKHPVIVGVFLYDAQRLGRIYELSEIT